MTAPRVSLSQQIEAVETALERVRALAQAGNARALPKRSVREEAFDAERLEAALATMRRWQSDATEIRAFLDLPVETRSLVIAHAPRLADLIRQESAGVAPASALPARGAGSRPRKAYAEDFEKFWSAYPVDPLMSKKAAAEAFDRLDVTGRAEAIEAIPAFRDYCTKNPSYRPVHAVRFLTQRRFDGFRAATAPAAIQQVFVTAGSREWDAWTKARGKPWPTTIGPDGKPGWYFPSPLPPNSEG